MALNDTTCSLEGLPFDVQFEVVTFLDFLSALNLASTNRYFHQVVKPQRNLSREELQRFLTERDNSQQLKFQNLFACFKCFRVLPKHKFARNATRQPGYKSGKKIVEQTERTCFDCAARLRVFDHLQPISNGKLNYYFCHNCGKYKTRSARCEGPSLKLDLDACLAIAACSTFEVRVKSPLEALPVHILRNVVSFLGFEDATSLAAVSHVLRDTIEPVKWVPLHTRFRAVRDKWHMDVIDVAEEDYTNYPCYFCCQIRPKAKFTETQIRKAHKFPQTMWKMRCQACLQQMYRRGRNLMRREHFRRLLCEICKCIMIGGETCGGCLELYVKGAIDQPTIYPKMVAAATRSKFAFEDHVHNYDGIFQDDFFFVSET